MNKYLSPSEVERIQQIMAEAERCATCTQPACVGICPDHVDPRPAFEFLNALLPEGARVTPDAQSAVRFADEGIEESFA